jgi:hypothetical protein
MSTVSIEQRKRIHPHKFTLWVAIGSIVMMFAGLTSAFIVKSNQTNFVEVTMPKVFWVSTAVIIISSITLQMALRSFKQREMAGLSATVGAEDNIQRFGSRAIFICDIWFACPACNRWFDCFTDNVY